MPGSAAKVIEHVRQEGHRLALIADPADLPEQQVAHGRVESFGPIVQDQQRRLGAGSCSGATTPAG